MVPLVARTIVLNFGLNKGKELFANQKGREHEVIKTLCAIKTIIAWHTASGAVTCRERCGGGGYLEINALPAIIMGGHSAMTAEGDNSVLM